MKKVLLSLVIAGIIVVPCYADETEGTLGMPISPDDIQMLDVQSMSENPDGMQELSPDNLEEAETEDEILDISAEDLALALEDVDLGMTVEEYKALLNKYALEGKEYNPEEIILRTDDVSFYANNISGVDGIGTTLSYEIVNNTEDAVVFFTDGISLNGWVVDINWGVPLEAKSHASGYIVIPEKTYKPFGISTQDIKDLEFYLGAFSERGSNGELIFGDYVQAHKNREDWSVEYAGEIPGTTIFDTPIIQLKVYGRVEDNAISQRFTFKNLTEDKLRVEMPLVKINNEVKETNIYFTMPPKKSGYKDVVWSQGEIKGVTSIVVNIKVYDVSKVDDYGNEEVLLDKNVEIVLN